MNIYRVSLANCQEMNSLHSTQFLFYLFLDKLFSCYSLKFLLLCILSKCHRVAE